METLALTLAIAAFVLLLAPAVLLPLLGDAAAPRGEAPLRGERARAARRAEPAATAGRGEDALAA